MPFFKTTKNILVDNEEYFDPNWMDSDKLVLPAKTMWDYARQIQIEDVNIWEQLYQRGGGFGIYASWDPYAEFYLITLPGLNGGTDKLETYYGPNASKEVYKRAKDFGYDMPLNKIWVEPEEMWLYQDPEPKFNTLILP